MAKRYHRSPRPEHQEASASTVPESSIAHPTPGQPERVPASLGKLHEIDLGQEAKLHNIARTEAATRRLAGDETEATAGEAAAPSEHVSLEDRRWRHRKRRTSADIQRDRLVEEVLRESKLDVYDEPDDDAPLDDQAADDRIAEQFRRDFMDAIQSRRVARTRNPKTEKDKAEAPKGPKLGGSRSARAAMRETQTKPGQK
ncbi:hypothetical protein N7512_001123 [Penicillium capsulatum]|nr:hypothetical protein N7512_001123 [Penicillium capsulatum]